MFSNLRYILCLATISLATLPSLARADFRVATVDVNRVLNESPDAKNKKKELDAASLKAKSKVDEERKVLKATEDKLKQSGAAPDSKEVEKFRQDAKDFARMVKDTDEDLRKQFMKINKELTDRALSAIRKYAEQNKIDLVLDKGESSRGPVLFGQASADITEEVIKQVNAK
ncbi:MAG: OmpH family outer membrane protein [Oligoflexia bacterium]|nr:OmpH family outer membrane protein [Oligoflexia bacterium]